ncbi:MAG: hypothetical protein IKF78_10800 [Atopobiaceae bacterium]|nr:hypothetical protein [Atopobiaceae bacterium]
MRDMPIKVVVIAGAVCGALLIGWAVVIIASSLSVEGEAGDRYGRLTIEYVEGDGGERGVDQKEAVAEATEETRQAQTDAADKTETEKGTEDGQKDKAPETQAADDERVATKNLSVAVVSVEPGPYDHHDNTPTTEVVVLMRNTSQHVIYVKPSNWDADTSNGRRVDHKIFVEDGDGDRSTCSFSPAAISPGATLEGTLYFDGDGLSAVLYEPHWLISGEDELVRFEVG